MVPFISDFGNTVQVLFLSQSMGFIMSSQQLNELWHLEFKWANELMGLPLRKCSAVSSGWGTPMKDEEFQRLKLCIKRMWLRAAIMFSCSYSNDKGWGLKVNDLNEKSLSLTSKSFTMLGWLAVCPNESQCPTAHRYLRSPIGKDLYLAGPLSLANWNQKPTIKAIRSISSTINKNCYQAISVKPLPPGTEITWDYGLHTEPILHRKHEWMLEVCCNEGQHAALLKPLSKSGQPSKKLRLVPSYRWCTYCGINLDAQERLQKNIKAHIALQHAVQVCFDEGLDVASVDGVDPASFFSQLHLVNKVIASLEAYTYNVKPASHIFQVLGREQLPSNASDEQRRDFFLLFQEEAKRAFQQYHVIYLRGITVPSCYFDLLPVETTTLKDVSWIGVKPPRSNEFSVDKLLSAEQKEGLQREIQVNMESIVKTYTDM